MLAEEEVAWRVADVRLVALGRRCSSVVAASDVAAAAVAYVSEASAEPVRKCAAASAVLEGVGASSSVVVGLLKLKALVS